MSSTCLRVPLQSRDFFIRNGIFRSETQFLHLKVNFYNGNTIFRLETRFLHFETKFRSEASFLDQKRHFYIGKEIFSMQARFLDWKSNFCIWNKIFIVETRSLIPKLFLSNKFSLTLLGHHLFNHELFFKNYIIAWKLSQFRFDLMFEVQESKTLSPWAFI